MTTTIPTQVDREARVLGAICDRHNVEVDDCLRTVVRGVAAIDDAIAFELALQLIRG